MLSKKFKYTFFMTVLLLVLSFSTAHAKDMAGHFGLGMDNTLTLADAGLGAIPSSPNSNNAPSYGISMKYWINNDWAIAGVLGFMYGTAAASQNTSLGDSGSFWAFALDLKGIYNFVKSDKANLGAFLTFHMRKENVTNDRPSGPYNSNLGFAFAIGLTPEVFLTDVFALTAELGLTIRVQEGFAAGFTGDNILGGFGFHYYF